MNNINFIPNRPYRLVFTSLCLALLAGLPAGNAHAAASTLADQFNTLDRDRDGSLTAKEIQAQPELVRFTNLYYRDSFRWADLNRDGQIDYEEFRSNEEGISAE